MTFKEFLNQAYLLDQRIKSDTLECEELRLMAETISSPGFEEHFNASRNTDAPYVRTLEKLMELEEKIMTEMSLLLEVKQQIREVISQVDKNEYQMVLKYRYIHNYSWPRIADMLNVDATTVQRWHNKAIGRMVLPKNCINLKIAMVCN